MTKTQLTARVPAPLAAWLEARARKNHRSANAELTVLLESAAAQDLALDRVARDRTAAMLADDVDTGGAHGSAATFRAHMDLIEAQEGVSVHVAAFKAECEGPDGFIRRRETAMRSEVAA